MGGTICMHLSFPNFPCVRLLAISCTLFRRTYLGIEWGLRMSLQPVMNLRRLTFHKRYIGLDPPFSHLLCEPQTNQRLAEVVTPTLSLVCCVNLKETKAG